MHIGMGYDVHRLVLGRDLIIGGVKIPYEKGLLKGNGEAILYDGLSCGCWECHLCSC